MYHLTHNAIRKSPMTTPVPQSGGRPQQPKVPSMSQDDQTEAGVSRMPLKALGLRTGMALQTRRLVEGASKKESQFFGAIESKGVMVGPLVPTGSTPNWMKGKFVLYGVLPGVTNSPF